MTDQEFDNYLALLSRLLRLDAKQRDAIAGELRTHLEDRLDELVARGVPRHEAVRRALEEFGDAASLAGEFVSISRGRRRRWIMRLTTASVAAIVLLAVGIITFWPGTNAGPGAATLIAQDPDQPELKQPDVKKPGSSEEAPPEDVLALEDKLNLRIDAEFVDTPLKDCLDFLANQTRIQFYVKQNKLEENGVLIDAPVTKNLKQVRMSTLLDLMLDELNLVYVEKDELLVVTTPEDAEATMEVRVYDCRDLVAMPDPSGRHGPSGSQNLPAINPGFPGARPSEFGPKLEAPAADPAPQRPNSEILPQFGGIGPGAASGAGGMPVGGGGMGGFAMGGNVAQSSGPSAPADHLIDIITTTVDPDSWNEVGGPGSIAEYSGLLVISQSARTHAKVEKVLDMLRKAADLPATKKQRVVR